MELRGTNSGSCRESGSATWTTAFGQERIQQFSAFFNRFMRFPAPPLRGGYRPPGPPRKAPPAWG
eukprot:3956454-Alexandrium_andersonii.AAC.1